MQYFKSIVFFITIILGTIIIAFSLLSLLYNTPLWWFKVVDFPRQQLFVLCLLCLLIFLLYGRLRSFWSIFFMLGLIASIALQLYYLLPYTPFTQPKVAQADADQVDPKATISLLIANVYMKNREAAAFLEIVEQTFPDMILAMETDKWWENVLKPVQATYPYSIRHPLDNTYGMLLYSKFPLLDSEVRFLQQADVPSFHTKVRLDNGMILHFHGVHPVPPAPSKHPDNIGKKEEALLEVGDMISRQQKPAIVAGDLNDVAWSHTSRLFQSRHQLYDTRIGRNFFNSFNAHSRIMRWPLDHVYVTEEFEVLDMKRLGKFGSDHFPLYVKLVLTD